MGRPRDPEVPERPAVCDIHGQVGFRLHKKGRTRAGTIRYIWRCPQCHTERTRIYQLQAEQRAWLDRN